MFGSPDFDLNAFLDFINSFYPSLKFTYEWSCENKISFLDILIHNLETCVKFDIFRKKRIQNLISIIFLMLRKKLN